MSVMPICTVERKRSGSLASFSAILADLLPFLRSVDRLDLRAEMTAISDMANMPLSKISIRIMAISSIS